MTWVTIFLTVQGCGDPRKMGALISFMWAAVATGPQWVLTNALMGTPMPFALASTLDGAGVPASQQAMSLVQPTFYG